MTAILLLLATAICSLASALASLLNGVGRLETFSSSDSSDDKEDAEESLEWASSSFFFTSLSVLILS